MKSTALHRSSRIAIGVLLCAGLALGGCRSSKGSSSYMDSYNSGNHTEAFQRASEASVKGPREEREQASLVAGLSAHSLGNNIQAKQYLQPLAYSQNAEIAGKANATLGLIADSEGDMAGAARSFELAGSKLTGDEAARAYLHAGDAYTAAGNKTLAQSMYKRGSTMVTGDPGLASAIRERMNATSTTASAAPGLTPGGGFGDAPTGPFSIQLGAFGNRANAEKLAAEVAANASAMGMGQPRIVPTTRNGQTLFAVRVGGFNDRRAAATARDRFGKGGFVAANGE